MSSAILYLAIVAIWAVVLVPRWLRPRPPQPVPVPAEQASAEGAGLGQDAASAWTATAGGRDTASGPDTARPDTESEQSPDKGPERAAAKDESEAPADLGPEEVPSPVIRRAEVVKARRRLLTTLITLTVIALALAVTRIDAYWITVPPAALLSGYLLLLRKFAQFDAQRARRAARIRHAAVVRADQEPSAPQEPVPAAPTAPGPSVGSVPGATAGPGSAEIIDISGRIGDQVYDQYSDAANRAVGD